MANTSLNEQQIKKGIMFHEVPKRTKLAQVFIVRQFRFNDELKLRIQKTKNLKTLNLI
jgi:hypothetical protein